MCLDQLPDEMSALGVADAKQDDRQVAGDAVSPQSGLLPSLKVP
jgi:hypothetical protein